MMLHEPVPGTSPTVTVVASTSMGRADLIAEAAGVHHVRVLDERGNELGVVCRCWLAEPGSLAGMRPVALLLGRNGPEACS